MRNATELFIRYRSTIGILSLIVLLYYSEPVKISILVGFLFMLCGIFFRAWSSGYLNKDRELATDGPYALTRNPLYFGNFLLGLGIAIAGNTIYTYSIFLAYYTLFFPLLMVIEHHRLKKMFGKEYESWAANHNAFFPKLKKVKNFGFNISFYMKNKEYRVIYFSLIIIAVLIVKFILAIRS